MDRIFFLFLAYTFIWGLIFWYTLKLGQRQVQISKELDLVKESLARSQGEAGYGK